MNKRTRFVILLAVLAVCFAFLWPSISWYYGTPKEMKALALGSLQSIKDYAAVRRRKGLYGCGAKRSERSARRILRLDKKDRRAEL